MIERRDNQALQPKVLTESKADQLDQPTILFGRSFPLLAPNLNPIPMAGSRYEYVKHFEGHERLLPGCWAVIRLDGRGFTKFCKTHDFEKPNDINALNLSNAAAAKVLHEFDEHIPFAFGQSDEYSFVLRRESTLFNRRYAKILSTVVSLFSSTYVALWSKYMSVDLKIIPSFDGRIVCYPTTKHLRDYLSWRQADVHVNNLFNTTFWALVLRGGMTTKDAELHLKGTLAKDKHEILFSKFGINYNDQHPMVKKGSFLSKAGHLHQSQSSQKLSSVMLPLHSSPHVSTARQTQCPRAQQCDNKLLIELQTHAQVSPNGDPEDAVVVAVYDDIISKQFWERNPQLLGNSDLDPPRIRK